MNRSLKVTNFQEPKIASNTKKVLLIGWDAADWKVINPLMDAGEMPALNWMVENGVKGNIATLHPVLSPMLWTSIATGKRPFKHGVHGFTEPTPDGLGVRPVTNLSRKTKAIWNILNQHGKKCNVVGWWPSHPAEPINGVMVSNHFQRAIGPEDEPWPVAPGTIHPPTLAENLAELRFHPNELGLDQVVQFIPKAAEVDQDKDRRLASFMKITAECTSIHAAATWLMTETEWDFMAVYFDAIDHFSHAFMRYHPPRQSHIPEKDFDLYKDVVNGGYKYHDAMLSTLLSLVDKETTVILISDHGFHPDHLRPRAIPREPAGPAAEHRQFGIFAMTGPNVKADEIVFGAGVLDIAPTVLTLYDLPVGEDMDGKPLLSAFATPPNIETIPSWDEISGEDGSHPPDYQLDPHTSREALKQLVDLGYIEKPDEDAEKAVEGCLREQRFNLAQSYMDADLYPDAMKLLTDLYAHYPDEYRFGIQLAVCYQAEGRVKDLRKLIERINEHRRDDAVDARKRLQEFAALARTRRSERKDSKATEGEQKPLFDEDERKEILRFRSLSKINPYTLDFLMGWVNFAEGKPDEAMAYLKKAEKAEPERPGLHIHIGETFLTLKKWDDAEKSFKKAVKINPDSPRGHLGLCKTHLRQRKNKKAALEGLTSVGLLYHHPLAHFYLGVALHRLGHIKRAVEALNVAIAQNANFAEVHERLSYIYRRRYKDIEKADHHRKLAKDIRRAHRRRSKSGDTSEGMAAATLSLGHAQRSAPPQLSRDDGANNDLLSVESETIREVAVTPGNGVGGTMAADVSADEIITIVTGLPRSGTSMMMQMLDAGGHPVLTDDVRKADKDNPRGYYEFKKATQLRTDCDWLEDAKGKAVKIVAQLLAYLPLHLHYRVIFMDRDLDEIIRSQRLMLRRLKRTGSELADDQLAEQYKRQLRHINIALLSRNISNLHVPYSETIDDPQATCQRINEFLGNSLDEQAMAKSVDSKLYRQRSR